MYYTDSPIPLYLGTYDHPSDVVGVRSIEVPSGSVTSLLRRQTQFVKKLEELVPGISFKTIRP